MIHLQKPRIAITMGDPLGIGPEIVIKAMTHKNIFEACDPVIVGDSEILYKAAQMTNNIHIFEKIKDMIVDIKVNNALADEASAGKAAFEYIKASTELCLDKITDSVATAPISKENLRSGKIDYIGHTEIYAGLTNTTDPLTMFETGSLRVFFLSRHVSLRDAINLIKKERLYNYIVKCQEALRKLGVAEGNMAVASLNPHSGENGMFGDEEILEIIPAVKKAREEGFNVAGPISADSVFHLAQTGRYNSVLSLYHDQGHIATKTLDFEGTISLTIGLPFLRTSVDHGTAPDIAWKGIAKERSMVEAIILSSKYALSYRG